MTAKKKGPRGPGRLTAEQTAAVSDRLLDAALAMFSEQGYARATMEQIAKRAGASTKTIYTRYANKGEILQAVVRRTLERVTAARSAEATVDLSKVDPATFLGSIGRQVMRITMGPEGAGLNRLAFAEARRFPEVAKFYREAMAFSNDQIREALHQWKKQDLFTALDNVELAADVCHSMLTDRSRLWTALGVPFGDTARDAHAAAAVATFLKGCGYKAASNKRSKRAAG